MYDDELIANIRMLEARAAAFMRRVRRSSTTDPALLEALDLAQAALAVLRAAGCGALAEREVGRAKPASKSAGPPLPGELVIASATHDLKNLLTIVGAHTQRLLQRAETQAALPAAQIVGELSSVHAAALQMAHLTEVLSEAAELRAEPPLNRRLIDLVELARRMADLYRRMSGQHQIEVVATTPALIGAFDEGGLERVFSNLLANAVKFSPHGGAITVSVAREDDPQGAWAVVAVRDQGIGIPAADLPHIFEHYRRASNTRGGIVGEGLGLAGARRIVELHGGTLAVSSQEGAGTTLTLRLPLLELPV